MDEDYKSLPLNPLRAFAVASRHKTFTAAAQYMGISQVAISRQIAILENYLGVKLFERGARSVKLTDVGRAFGREITGPFDDLERATHRILAYERENTINLRIYPTLAHHWLIPNLPGFMATNPGYQVRLDTSVEPLDFRGTHLDVALQLGHGDWREAQSRKLYDEVLDAVCSPDYAAQFNDFKDPADLGKAELLHAKYRRREWEMWANSAGVSIDHLSGTAFDTSLLTYSAAIHGLGIAIGQLHLLQAELQSGRLVRPFNRNQKTGAAFHVVWPVTRSVSIQTKRFIDWLLHLAGEEPQFFKKKA